MLTLLFVLAPIIASAAEQLTLEQALGRAEEASEELHIIELDAAARAGRSKRRLLADCRNSIQRPVPLHFRGHEL